MVVYCVADDNERLFEAHEQDEAWTLYAILHFARDMMVLLSSNERDPAFYCLQYTIEQGDSIRE